MKCRESIQSINYRCTKHRVFLGKKEDKLKKVATLKDEKNVFKNKKLKAGKSYYWRVDCEKNNGEKIGGDVWKFTIE